VFVRHDDQEVLCIHVSVLRRLCDPRPRGEWFGPWPVGRRGAVAIDANG
jgi:hypothetical protein